MICNMPYLVGTGFLPDAKMSVAAKCLADEWGGDLLKISCNENPHKFISTFDNDNKNQIINKYISFLEKLI